MKESIYRKLKDYIEHEDNFVTVIFGDLMSKDCQFVYEDEYGELQEWEGTGNYCGEVDFLLDYYVIGIFPRYKIERDKIIPFLRIALERR